MVSSNNAKGQWQERKLKARSRKLSRFHQRSSQHAERRKKMGSSSSEQSAKQPSHTAARSANSAEDELFLELLDLSKDEQLALKKDLQRLSNQLGKLASKLTGNEGVNRQAVSKALDAIVDMAATL